MSRPATASNTAHHFPLARHPSLAAIDRDLITGQTFTVIARAYSTPDHPVTATSLRSRRRHLVRVLTDEADSRALGIASRQFGRCLESLLEANLRSITQEIGEAMRLWKADPAQHLPYLQQALETAKVQAEIVDRWKGWEMEAERRRSEREERKAFLQAGVQLPPVLGGSAAPAAPGNGNGGGGGPAAAVSGLMQGLAGLLAAGDGQGGGIGAVAAIGQCVAVPKAPPGMGPGAEVAEVVEVEHQTSPVSK